MRGFLTGHDTQFGAHTGVQTTVRVRHVRFHSKTVRLAIAEPRDVTDVSFNHPALTDAVLESVAVRLQRAFETVKILASQSRSNEYASFIRT